MKYNSSAITSAIIASGTDLCCATSRRLFLDSWQECSPSSRRSGCTSTTLTPEDVPSNSASTCADPGRCIWASRHHDPAWKAQQIRGFRVAGYTTACRILVPSSIRQIQPWILKPILHKTRNPKPALPQGSTAIACPHDWRRLPSSLCRPAWTESSLQCNFISSS